MTIVNCLDLSGIAVTPIPNYNFSVTDTTGFPGYPTIPSLTPDTEYLFLFSNIDGAVSKNLLAPPGAGYATYYYRLVATSGSGGPSGSPSVFAIGFDATADLMAPVTFSENLKDLITIDQPTHVDGPPIYIDAPTFSPIASGTAIDTENVVVTLIAPATDGVAQGSGYQPAAFNSWMSVTTGDIQNAPGTAGGPGFEPGNLKPISENGPLVLAAGADDFFLAIYVAAQKATSTPPVFPPIHPASNCPELLANATEAAETLSSAQANPASTVGLLNALQNMATAAEEAAAPCRAGEISARGL